MKILFDWDPVKAASNLRKHKVGFATASRVFADPLRMTALDRVVDGEIRWRTIGIVEGFVPLVVAHTWQEKDDGTGIIRIISARRAGREERRRYEEENGEI